MVKETSNNAHPKAVNIIRPTHSLSVKRSTQQVPFSSSATTNTLTIPSNKPRVAHSAKINLEESRYTTRKPQLNIYHPPSRHSQSRRPTIASDCHRQQSVQKVQPTIATGGTWTTTTTTKSKPSFEVYRPPIKQPLSRSSTAPIIPSTTASTPVSISKHFNRQQPSSRQVQRRPISQTVSTHTSAPSSSPLSRSATHHSLITSTTSPSLYIGHDSDSSISSSIICSDDDSEDECSEMQQYSIRRCHSGSDSDTFVIDTPLAAEKEKSLSNHDEDEGEEERKEEEEEMEEEEEGSLINEARVNRKIADLEISNRSLLAVNEMLEITVRRQATQVAQLKQQIAQDGTTVTKPLVPAIEVVEISSDEDWETDDMFQRICQMTENMIKSGEASIHYECKNLGGRVLTNYHQSEENIHGRKHEIVKEEVEKKCFDSNDVRNINDGDQDVNLGQEYEIPSKSNVSSQQQVEEILVKPPIEEPTNLSRRRPRWDYPDSITWQPHKSRDTA